MALVAGNVLMGTQQPAPIVTPAPRFFSGQTDNVSSDSATSLEATTLTVSLTFTETSVTVESATVTVASSSADTATSGEAQTVSVFATGADTANRTEVETLTADQSGADARPSVVEGSSVAATVPTSGDARSTSEGQTLSVAAQSADLSPSIEAGAVAVTLSFADTVTATEGFTLDQGATPKSSGDTTSSSFGQNIVATITGSDVRSVFDSFSAMLSAITSTEVTVTVEGNHKTGGPKRDGGPGTEINTHNSKHSDGSVTFMTKRMEG